MSRKPRNTAKRSDDVAVAGHVDVGNDSVTGGDGGSDEIVASTVDPATVTGSDGAIGDDHTSGDLGSGPEQPTKRGRGRPKGSGTGPKDKTLPLNVKGIEKLLVGIHGGIALLLSSPSFALDTDLRIYDGKTEAEFLAASVADVARHYNPKVFDQKTADWFNLAQCLAFVYGPRIYNARADRRANAARPVNVAPRAGPRPVDPMPAANKATNGHATPVPPNDFASKDVLTGEIPGVGKVEFPQDFFSSKLN
jgi:hypothetical protein